MDKALMTFMGIFEPYMNEVIEVLPTVDAIKNAKNKKEIKKILDESRKDYLKRNGLCQEK